MISPREETNLPKHGQDERSTRSMYIDRGAVIGFLGTDAPWYADVQTREDLFINLSTRGDLLPGNASASVITRHFAYKTAPKGAQPMSMNWLLLPSVRLGQSFSDPEGKMID